MKVTLHHLDDSRSQRILWLLEELEVDYAIERYQRDENMRAPASLRKVHPLGKSPALEIDGRVYAETGAVVETIIDHFGDGRMRPSTDSDDFDRYRYFLHYAEGSLMPPLLVKLIMGQVRAAPVPFFLKPVVKKIASTVDGNFTNAELERNFSFLNQELEGREWFAGELSGADIMLSFPIEAAAGRADLTPYANVTSFIERVHARPAYQRALEKGGEYSYA